MTLLVDSWVGIGHGVVSSYVNACLHEHTWTYSWYCMLFCSLSCKATGISFSNPGPASKHHGENVYPPRRFSVSRESVEEANHLQVTVMDDSSCKSHGGTVLCSILGDTTGELAL